MDFISASFIALVIILAVFYFIVPDRCKWVVLLLGSYVFYAFSGIKLLAFLIFTTGVTFIGGLFLGKINREHTQHLEEYKGKLTREEKKSLKSRAIAKKKRVVACVVIVNLGILIFLKYFNFIAENINAVFGRIGVGRSIPMLTLLLPLGISFYTLQSIGYIVDLYRGKYQPDENFFRFSLFMSFFPQIVQGPIARYDQLAHQL